jgi:hypothetical protein
MSEVDRVVHLPLHADSACERPLAEPKPTMTLAASYLPGYAVLTLESPLRTVVVNVKQLIGALKSI